MYTLTDAAPSGLTLMDFPAPAGRVIKGAFDEAVETNPVPMYLLSRELNANKDSPRLEWWEATDQAKKAGVKVTVPDDGITQSALSILIERRKDDAARDMLFARREGPVAAVGTFGAGLAGAMMDPVNAAAGFVPVLSGTRYAAALAKATTVGSRTALRAGVGAAEGLAGAALVEAPTIGLRRDLQDEYGLYDSLANIAFGTFASAGLRSVGGAARDRWRGLQAARQEDYLRSIEPSEWAAVRATHEQSIGRDMEADLGGFERGFSTDSPAPPNVSGRTWYHGTGSDIREWSMDKTFIRSEGAVIWFSDSPELAERAANRQTSRRGGENIIPVDITHGKFIEINAYEGESVSKAIERAKKTGGDAVLIHGMKDFGVDTDVIAVLNKDNIRFKYASPKTPYEALAAISDDTHAHAIKTAIAQAIEGRRIDVDAVVRQDKAFGPEQISRAEVIKRAQANMAPEAKVGGDAAASRRADGAKTPAADLVGAEPPPPLGSSGKAAGAEAKPASLVDAEERLAETRIAVEKAANDAGLPPPSGEAALMKQSETYEKAWQAIAACAQGRGL